jgi:DNA-binding response OmpR family regulator
MGPGFTGWHIWHHLCQLLYMISPASILVLDDDIDLLFIVKILLSKDGYAVTTLSDCTKFFTMLSDNPKPDLILLDINLGPCDGRHLCSRAKRMIEFYKVPIVLYSSDIYDNTMCASFSAAGFIQKPFNISDFSTRIGKLIANNIYVLAARNPVYLLP